MVKGSRGSRRVLIIKVTGEKKNETLSIDEPIGFSLNNSSMNDEAQ